MHINKLSFVRNIASDGVFLTSSKEIFSVLQKLTYCKNFFITFMMCCGFLACFRCNIGLCKTLFLCMADNAVGFEIGVLFFSKQVNHSSDLKLFFI